MILPLSPPDLVILPANGTTVAAEELHAALVFAVERAPVLRIDASGIDHVGQAVLQLLIAARIAAHARGIDFIIERPSEAFRSRVAACCLTPRLGLDLETEQGQ